MVERDPSEEAPLTEADPGSSREDGTHSGRGGAWIYLNLRWKKDRLKVHFMNACRRCGVGPGPTSPSPRGRCWSG